MTDGAVIPSHSSLYTHLFTDGIPTLTSRVRAMIIGWEEVEVHAKKPD